MRRRILLPAFLFLASAGAAGGTPVAPLDASGLDLIVLVDQSGSVSRHSIRRQLVASTAEVVARSAAPLRVRHRLAVVSFGSSARIDLPWTEVGAGPLAAVRRSLKAIRFEEGSPATDFLAGFTVAAEMFAALPLAPERRRAILLLSDGVPDAPGVEADLALRRLKTFVASRLMDPPTRIEVGMLRSPVHDAASRYRDFWISLTGGRLYELRGGPSEMVVAHLGAVGRLVEAPMVESGPMVSTGEASAASLVLPPYLDLVVFDVVGEAPGARVEILEPAASRGPSTASAKGVDETRLGQVIRTVVVRRPEPGVWRFRAARSAARVRILSQQFFPRGELVAPARGEPLRQHERMEIAYRVTDPSGFPLAELPGYPVSLALTLVQPDGRRRRLGMARGSAPGTATFHAVEDVECDVPGRYWTEVEISTRDLNAAEVTIFRDRWSGFMVSRATLVECRLVAPQSGAVLPVRSPLSRDAVATHVECVHGTRPFAMESIAGPVPESIFRPALVREGEPSTTTLDLDYRGGGVFDGWLRGTERPGEYGLRLDVDQARVAADFNVRLSPPELRLVRRQDWRSWRGALGLAAGVALSILGGAVWRRWK